MSSGSGILPEIDGRQELLARLGLGAEDAQHVTAERVKAHFADIVKGAVQRYELPALGALNFVLHEALGGGVTRSLSLDSHGKSLSSCLLELEIPDRQERRGRP